MVVKVISIDPGRTTGYCFAKIEDGELHYYPFQSDDEVDDLWRKLEEFKPNYIIIEDFEFRKGKHRAKLDLFPVQLIGIASLYVNFVDPYCVLFIQKASIGKEYYTDNVLKQLGLYERGKPHAMDASRHLLQWCMFRAGNKYIGQKRTEEFANVTDKNWWKEKEK